MDYYRRGGDSLQGRYHYYRLHPFTLPEINRAPHTSDVEHLLRFGGFPEPLIKGNDRFSRRFQRERTQRVIYDDIRDLENLRDVSLMELLAEELPERVGSPLSLRNLSDVLGVAQATAARWVEILERMYHCFRIAPYGARRIRAVKKEQKLYMWDWSLVQDQGARFENMVASHLLKHCHLLEDREGHRMELRFLRDTDRREVDFVVLKDRRPELAVECKTGEKAGSIHYFKERTTIKRFYQVHMGNDDYEKDGVRVLPFAKLCLIAGLP